MSDYKRLTKKEGIGRFVNHDCITCSQHKDDRTGCDFCGGSEYSNNWCCGVLYNRLAELEDKIENGTLIELPYLHHHKENINGLNYEFWQVVFNYKGAILKTKVIYDKAEAEAELAKIRGQK